MFTRIIITIANAKPHINIVIDLAQVTVVSFESRFISNKNRYNIINKRHNITSYLTLGQYK